LEAYAQNQGVDLRLHLAADSCPYQGDERRLESAIYNLIGNAIKYSPDGGPVDVFVESHDGNITIQVKDQGIGIQPEHLEDIFENFFRVRTPETQQIEGSGLGLPIVKTVVAKHGGEVMVTSTPGEGSTFGFSLPAQNH
jgi:two-component system phosphate regulon sensor histidine kinase PhoR